MREYPTLSPEKEAELAHKWHKEGCRRSFDVLVNSHIRLAVRIASAHSGYGMDVEELTEEAMVGITRAAETFNPDMKLRFATYAMYWADSCIKKYIQKNVFLFSIPDVADAKRIFFRLGRLKRSHGYEGPLSQEQAHTLAAELDVTPQRLMEVESAMSAVGISVERRNNSDTEETSAVDSLPSDRPSPEQNTVDKDEKNHQLKLLSQAMNCLTERENSILSARRLAETPSTLDELGTVYGISKERVRQIEEMAFKKITKKISELMKQNHKEREVQSA